MISLHQRRTHAEPVAGCFGCHLSSLQVAPGEPTQQEKAENQWADDLWEDAA